MARNKKRYYAHAWVAVAALLVVILLSAAIYVTLNANKNIAGEAIKFSANSIPNNIPAPPPGIAMFCPGELVPKNTQNFVNVPNGYSLLPIPISDVNCYGPAQIYCDYEGIRTFKDLSQYYVSCIDNPNDRYSCVCVPKQ
jgi:hypothetical protein